MYKMLTAQICGLFLLFIVSQFWGIRVIRRDSDIYIRSVDVLKMLGLNFVFTVATYFGLGYVV